MNIEIFFNNICLYFDREKKHVLSLISGKAELGYGMASYYLLSVKIDPPVVPRAEFPAFTLDRETYWDDPLFRMIEDSIINSCWHDIDEQIENQYSPETRADRDIGYRKNSW